MMVRKRKRMGGEDEEKKEKAEAALHMNTFGDAAICDVEQRWGSLNGTSEAFKVWGDGLA